MKGRRKPAFSGRRFGEGSGCKDAARREGPRSFVCFLSGKSDLAKPGRGKGRQAGKAVRLFVPLNPTRLRRTPGPRNRKENRDGGRVRIFRSPGHPRRAGDRAAVPAGQRGGDSWPGRSVTKCGYGNADIKKAGSAGRFYLLEFVFGCVYNFTTFAA
ncbi:MAG: hypothetical protein C6W57_08235 [Caldibacillus debilis]|nr:MAG: hypothetical protein C6W57_08235 [Caldibacillus debilis]